ncbi:MAG: VOC family protein [Thermoanaerobaculia bacterium]
MPEITQHAPGSFCWPELQTTSSVGAKSFYTTLFGWAANDDEVSPGKYYTMLTLKGLAVGALYELGAESASQGTTSHWGSYISVADIDASAARAEELGAEILAPPFDVMDVGRMAVVKDPVGAVFSLWQPKVHIGAHVMGEPNSLCWTELSTRDIPAAKTFYTGLFGWTTKDSPEYIEVMNQGRPIAGMMAPPQEGIPPHWLVYFAVSDCDASVTKASGLGAITVVPAMDIPNVGRFSVLKDPQGAVFAIIQLLPRAGEEKTGP